MHIYMGVRCYLEETGIKVEYELSTAATAGIHFYEGTGK